MSEIVTISAEELSALREQIAQQKLLLDEQESALNEQQATLQLKDKTIVEHEETIAWLQERLNLLLAKRYKHSSEKGNALQMSLLDQEELDEAIAEAARKLEEAQAAMDAAQQGCDDESDEEASDNATSKKKPNTKPARNNPPKRTPLPEHLRRVTVDVHLSDEQKQAMQGEWEQIGWETSEQLAVQEREYFVKVVRRAKFVRKTPDGHGHNSQGIKVAPTLPVILPRSIADASLLAKILAGKYIDAMSFARECKVLQREGVHIGYSTLCSYPIQLTERLEPIRELLYEYAAVQPLWHLDETTLQVLDEPGRDARQKSYIWGLCAGPPGSEVVIFHYNERRNYEALSSWLEEPLKSFNGVIITDEHKPYAKLASDTKGIQIRGGCWAHCRRKYTDTVKGRRNGSDAHKLIQDIATLYKLEAKVQARPLEQRLELREKLIRPWLDAFKQKVDALIPVYADKSLMHSALFYTQNNWEALTAFMSNAHLPLDNNRIESAIRPFALGEQKPALSSIRWLRVQNAAALNPKRICWSCLSAIPTPQHVRSVASYYLNL